MNQRQNNLRQSQRVEACELNIISCNVRGVSNKSKSIENILIENEVDICVLSELNTQNLPKFKGFTPFINYSKQKFHGICILVNNSISKHVLRIPDESQLETVHIRIGHTVPALNILGTYLPVEARLSVEQTDSIWKCLTDKVDSILQTHEAALVIGDLNRPLQARKPSHGTKLLQTWLGEGNMRLLNGNIPTRIDPASGQGSILDLAIVSDSIAQNVQSFHVDNHQKMTPFSMRKVRGVIEKKFTDHLTINVKLSLNCVVKKVNNKKTPFINYHNKEGWAKYEKVSNSYAEKMMDLINSTEDITKLDIALDWLDQMMHVEAFGLIWVGPNKKPKLKKKESKELKEMFEEQIEELGIMIEQGLSGKDLNQQIYNLKKIITGPKVRAQEAMAINDPVTNELITDIEKIKEVSLQHNINILKKKDPKPEDIPLINEKKERHEKMMNRHEKEDEWDLDIEMYCKVTDKIKTKKKKMYDLFNYAGAAYKMAIYEYMKKVIKCEQIPRQYKLTTLSQIWKGKGSPLSLNNMRFIHMKAWKPKLLECLVTEKMKPKIVDATPKFQLGGMPGASSVEHLVVLKTWMKMKEIKKENGIFMCFDMAKFFDKESLLDCMDTLNTKAKVDSKSYRLWYKLNESTEIRVKTSVGLSDTAKIEDSIGQGSGGAALVSSLNIGAAMHDTFPHEASTKIGHVGLNNLIFQDDISKLNDSLEQARKDCQKIDRTLESKLLSLNYDKSKYMIIGSTKYRNKTLKELEKSPMKMGSSTIDHSSSEKYLGDIIHEKGCKESITQTIQDRTRKLISKCEDIIQIAEAPIMGGLRKGNVAFKLFEAQIVPALLHNCESWIGIDHKHVELLQKFQERFIRRVLRLPDSTPKAILQHDTGMWPMEWRIKLKKLVFVNKIMKKSDSNIAKNILSMDILYNFKGLAWECYDVCRVIGMDPLDVWLGYAPNFMMKRWINEHIWNTNEAEMKKLKKVADRLSDNPHDYSYLNTMNLYHSRIWFRYRARCIAGVKANAKRSHADLSCRFCVSGPPEDQEHLEVCEGMRYERRGLDMQRRWGKLQFWRRCCTKLAAVAAGSSPPAGPTLVSDQLIQSNPPGLADI